MEIGSIFSSLVSLSSHYRLVVRTHGPQAWLLQVGLHVEAFFFCDKMGVCVLCMPVCVLCMFVCGGGGVAMHHLEGIIVHSVQSI